MTEPPEERTLTPDGKGQVIPRGRVRRSLPLAGFYARTAGEAVVASLATRPRRAERFERLHERAAERYVELLGNSRGALMKVGQLMSAFDVSALEHAPTLEVYRSALVRLQADAPPMAADLARATIEAELGRPIDEVFATFDDQHLAAASIGQVHAATLPDGRAVVVKVQYPGVADAVRADVANTELVLTFCRIIGSVLPGSSIDFRSIGDEVAARIAEELDYVREAENITAFADRYRDHPFIRVPDVVPEASTERVLTMTRLHGRRLSEVEGAPQATKDRWGEILFRFGNGSRASDRMINTDPNPANYLLGDDGTVGFVDFGCVKRFDEADHALVYDYNWAVIDGDATRLRQLMIDGGILKPSSDLTADELLTWARLPLLSITAPQPFTVTPEYLAVAGPAAMMPTGPQRHVSGQLNLPPAFLFVSRLDAGLHGTLARLRATADWRGVLDELDGRGPPIGELGEIHAAWAENRDRT